MPDNSWESAVPAKEPVGYTDRLIAFVDILGWRSFIEGLDAAPGRFARALGALKTFEEHARGARAASEMRGARTSMFSDCIVVSCLDIPGNYLGFLSAVSTMCFELFGAADLLCRGGIVRGLMFHEDGRAFGAGLTAAYDLESTKAIYPRLVLDDSVIRGLLSSEVGQHRDPLDLPSRHFYVRADRSDGLQYLDYLRALFEFRVAGKSDLTQRDKERGMYHVRKGLLRLWREAPQTPRVLAKYEWYASYVNAVAADIGLPTSSFTSPGRG